MSDTLWFGFDATATCGVDPRLCEWRLPTWPPSGLLHAVLGGNCTGSFDSFRDFRRFENPEKIDTFRLRFQPGDAGFPMRVRWNPEEIRAMCDSAIIQDEVGGSLFSVKMEAESLLVVTNPAIFSARIIQFGQRGVTNVHATAHSPQTVRLYQNYPNPFNPLTTISLHLPVTSFVTLTIFNSLGERIETPVNQALEPGSHAIRWDASNVPSGVYYYRLTASGFSRTGKMVLIR